MRCCPGAGRCLLAAAPPPGAAPPPPDVGPPPPGGEGGAPPPPPPPPPPGGRPRLPVNFQILPPRGPCPTCVQPGPGGVGPCHWLPIMPIAMPSSIHSSKDIRPDGGA